MCETADNTALSLLFGLVPVLSHNGAVLPRRPVAERRHLDRVLCGPMCPLRYAPSASAAAGAAQLRYGVPSGTKQTVLIY